MKFTISSSELLNRLSVLSRVINSRNTIPILDNILFTFDGKQLTLTASDLECTLSSRMILDQDNTGCVALPAKLLTDALKGYADQPLTFEINENKLKVKSGTGQFETGCFDGRDYPKTQFEYDRSFSFSQDTLLTGISKTLFASSDDDLRPVLNGIFIESNASDLSFVASDAHKLVVYKKANTNENYLGSFILPRKAAVLLKSILGKQDNVNIQLSPKYASFDCGNYTLVCRLQDGNFPNYQSIIPQDNPNKFTTDRAMLINSLKRVSVFCSPNSQLVMFDLDKDAKVSAQDMDFQVSAFEKLTGTYSGDPLKIGFKASFLQEMLQNITRDQVTIEMSDPTRAGVIRCNEDGLLMLIMPMMVNA